MIIFARVLIDFEVGLSVVGGEGLFDGILCVAEMFKEDEMNLEAILKKSIVKFKSNLSNCHGCTS